MHLISEVLGSPNKEFVKTLPRRKYFFDDKYELHVRKNECNEV